MNQAAMHAENEVRTLMESWQKSASAGDLNAIMSPYAADIVAYDAILALQFKGIDAYKKHWQTCLAMCNGPMEFKLLDTHIVAGDAMAFSYSLNQCGGTDSKGEQHSSWMRVTTGYRKINGQWKIVHEHFSAPFDPESGKALFDLQP